MRYLLFFLFCSTMITVYAQQETIYNDDPLQKRPLGLEESHYYYRVPDGKNFSEARVEPPNWWVGMAQRSLEVLIYDKDISMLEPRVTYPGVSIVKTTRLENPNYLFVHLDIGPGAKAGSFKINLMDIDNSDTVLKSYNYELKERNNSPKAQGVTAEDFIYLIMPDRFANGDKGNDSVEGMMQTGVNRDKVFFRHGGDLIGVMEHLDYLSEMGVTALWLNPILENDQPYESYHGYAVTDHYEIDARFGNNEQYRQLVNLAHEQGQKVIMDVIFNHTGDEHWFIKDLPSSDWIHQWEDGFQDISYRAPVLMDPYRATSDYLQVSESWFDKHMPDLNQLQPQLANYLIQNTIWWTEYSGQDGFRIDTYAYCDQGFMAEWNRRMLEEYPELGIFAETWVHGPGIQSWFPEGQRADRHDSSLPGVTDYQLYYAINEALSQPQGWTSGVAKLYYTLAQDYLYADPYRNVLFLDNHDLGRIFGNLDGHVEKFKSAMSLLMTLRGIPMIYYGTEILMTGSGGAFGEGGRKDFPGGFAGDKYNKFKERDRSKSEREAFDFVSTLANYRKQTTALQTGKLTQYIPQDGIYVYFRYDADKTVMVAYNSNEETVQLDTSRFTDQMAGFTSATDVISSKTIRDLGTLEIVGYGTVVLELR